MLLNRDTLIGAYIAYSTIFDMSLKTTPVIYPSIATVINNAGPITQFKWLGDVPVMTEWIGNRVIQRLRADGHQLKTRWYANGIELDVEDVSEDKLGLVTPRIQQLAQMGPKKIDAMTIDYLNRGFGGTLGLTYDGQYLFDTDHTASGGGAAIGEAAQSNVITGAFTAATLNTGLTQFMNFKSANGEPLELKPELLLVGPSNQLAVRQVLTTMYGANGSSNVDQGIVKAVVNARISGSFAGQWYLFGDGPIKPVIVGVEVPPQFHELMGWDQLHQFMNRTMLAGADMKVGLAYGAWQNVLGSAG